MAVFPFPYRAMLEALFPLSCIRCGESGAYCCAACLSRVVHVTRKVVKSPVPVYSGYPYADPVVRTLIHDFKYRNLAAAKTPLRTLVERWALISGGLIPEDCLLVPVPLHPAKRRHRGFNQAETVAELLGQAVDLPVEPRLLFRVRKGASQTETVDRKANVAGAFAARPGDGRAVFLVDDVVTSGSTMRACASALASSGFVVRGGFALAWGVQKDEHQKTTA